MNITRNNIDELNASIKIQILPSDYEPKVEQVLKDYRRKANIKGFRTGMVPMGMVKKMYGKAVLYDEINKLVSDSLFGYIKDENIDILGEPLPNENQQTVDFDTQTEFEFIFDLGLAPKFDVTLNKDTKLPYHKIIVDDKIIETDLESYVNRYSVEVPVETVDEKSFVKGSVHEVNADNTVIENGLTAEEAYVSYKLIEDKETKEKFMGLKAGDKVIVDLKKVYATNFVPTAKKMFNLEEDAAAESITNNFEFTVTEIYSYKAPEMNQDFFDKVLGEGKATTEEELKQGLKENISKIFDNESDYKLLIDTRDQFITELGIEIPGDFLKRWLLLTVAQNQKKELTAEEIEKEFPAFIKDMKWRLIKNRIAKDFELKVTENDLIEVAKKLIAQQFMQYGLSMASIPDDRLTEYAKKQIENKDERERMAEQKLEEKIIETIKSNVTLEIKEMTMDEFKEAFASKKAE